MSEETIVSEDVKSFVSGIITKKNLDPNSKVIYSEGSEVGDNYSSKTVTVDIISDKETISLFVKYALDVNSREALFLHRLYANEILFYDVLYPAYLKFEEAKGIPETFANIPKCIGTSTKDVVALENLKYKNFFLFDRKQTMNEGHIVSVLKAFAKYHAVSFAFKDQMKAKHEEIAGEILDLFGNKERSSNLEKMIMKIMRGFQEQLHPVDDKAISDKYDQLRESVAYYFNNFRSFQNDYSIITKGDCWSNNIMFRYDGENKETPSDVMLIDWQLITPGSPVLDLSYFLYTVASKEELANLHYYMKLYHDELSKRIKLLDSDPEVQYPYAVFVHEWKESCIFGYGMSLIVFNIMLMSKEEAPDFMRSSKLLPILLYKLNLLKQ